MIRKGRETSKRNSKTKNITITNGKLKKQLQEIKNWKAPGPEGQQVYWIKTFTSFHERTAAQYNYA